MRNFVIDLSHVIFCMPETWLYYDDSAIISVLTPESHVLNHVPRPDQKGGGVGWLINKSIQSKKPNTKSFESFRK